MAHTIPRPARLGIARPGGTPSPTMPARRPDAPARASYPGLYEPGSGGDGGRAGDRHGDAGAG